MLADVPAKRLRRCITAALNSSLIFAGVLAVSTGLARAQDTVQAARPNSGDSSVAAFQSALSAVASRDHVGFVIEGEPHPIVIAQRAANNAIARERRNSNSVPGSSLNAISGFAESYDYSVVRRGNLYLLKKMYTYPSDIPAVTPEELLFSVTELFNILRHVSADLGTGSHVPGLSGLVASLTPDQWASLASAHFLRVKTDLNEEQRGAISAFVLGQYVMGADYLEAADEMLNPKSSPEFIRENERTFAGAATPIVETKPVKFVRPIAETVNTKHRSRAEGATTDDAAVEDGIAMRCESEMVEQTLNHDYPHIQVTIAELVDRLNRRSQQQKIHLNKAVDPIYSFTVESYLAGKPVTLIGDMNASPSQVAAAVAEIYGLRVQRSPNAPTVQKITRFPAPKLQDPADASDIAHHVLPAPLLRALQVDKEDNLRAMATYNRITSPEERLAMRKKIGLHAIVVQHRRSVINAAARQLTGILRAKLAFPGSHVGSLPTEIPVRSTKAYTRSLYATYLMRDFSNSMDRIMYAPLTITHFSELCLTCSVDSTNKSKPRANLGLSMYDPEAKGLGIGIIYTSVPLPADVRPNDAP